VTTKSVRTSKNEEIGIGPDLEQAQITAIAMGNPEYRKEAEYTQIARGEPQATGQLSKGTGETGFSRTGCTGEAEVLM